VEFQYFPLWYFKTKDAKGKEKVRLEPAAATTVTEITRLNLPAGDLVQYDHRIDADAHAPSVPLNAALSWAEQNAKDFKQSEVIETSLVHIPIYIFKYVLEGKNYTALVDGSSSVVFANIFPAKAETPYQLVGGLAAVTYLVLAIFPVVGAMFGDGGFGIGFAIFCVVGLPAGIGLMALAAWVSQKV
jgi:hypothetical protein